MQVLRQPPYLELSAASRYVRPMTLAAHA